MLRFGIVILSTINKGHRIEAEMVVQMVFVKVSSNDYLIPITPHFFCGLQPDFVCFFSRDFVRLCLCISKGTAEAMPLQFHYLLDD